MTDMIYAFISTIFTFLCVYIFVLCHCGERGGGFNNSIAKILFYVEKQLKNLFWNIGKVG